MKDSTRRGSDRKTVRPDTKSYHVTQIVEDDLVERRERLKQGVQVKGAQGQSLLIVAASVNSEPAVSKPTAANRKTEIEK
jgi:hypothetical protein